MQKTAWELISPAGITQVRSDTINPRPASLEGKRILLRWNGKHNGDVFLNRIGELLTERVKGITLIKNWEAAPETQRVSQNAEVSQSFARQLVDLKPDISIGSQGD